MTSLLVTTLILPFSVSLSLTHTLSLSSSLTEAQDPVALEESNIRLKPYLKQLNALKASLSCQLRELEDSRAFISLGISKEATEAMIKKAYHSKAIKLRTYCTCHLIGYTAVYDCTEL